MKKIKMILVLWGLVANVVAQEKGIQFRDFDNWQAVLDAAKTENKPIFVDFFTTWCGPCKMLERDVYPKPEVGAYFNEHYISIKVQMDKTSKDSEQVRKWYPDISKLEKEYNIKAYPTLLFLSPIGEIRNVEAGYKDAAELIKLATVSLTPGQRYADPTDQYYQVIRDWQQGGDGMAIAKLINTLVADEKNYFRGKEQVLDSLTKASMAYFRTRPLTALYTKDALEIIGRVGVNVKDSLFTLFYPNTKKVDRIVGREYYGRLVVDRAIQREFFLPDPSTNRKSPLSDKQVNWDSLYAVVKSGYSTDYAKQSIAAAKTIRCGIQQDMDGFTIGSLDFVKRYGTLAYLQIAFEILGFVQTDINDVGKLEALAFNMFCWKFVFGHSNDPKQLKSAIKLMRPLVDLAEQRQSWWFSQCGDTYANLLFKAGERDEAIAVQTRVIEFSRQQKVPESNIKDLQQVLANMKANIPTWSINR